MRGAPILKLYQYNKGKNMGNQQLKDLGKGNIQDKDFQQSQGQSPKKSSNVRDNITQMNQDSQMNQRQHIFLEEKDIEFGFKKKTKQFIKKQQDQAQLEIMKIEEKCQALFEQEKIQQSVKDSKPQLKVEQESQQKAQDLDGLQHDSINNTILQMKKQELTYQIEAIKQVQTISSKQKQDHSFKNDYCFEKIICFSTVLKGGTIFLDQQNKRLSCQKGLYYQNQKLILSQPILKRQAKAIFKIINLKYCLGVGIALKEVIQHHQFNYKSYQNQLSHGLFLVTSQGYSWSHAFKDEDDKFYKGFKKIKNDDEIQVTLNYSSLMFKYMDESFELKIPQSIFQKYTLCFVGYLHEKGDSLALIEF